MYIHGHSTVQQGEQNKMKRGELDSKNCVTPFHSYQLLFVILEIMKEYFYSWRPYKLIIARLEEVDGIKKGLCLNNVSILTVILGIFSYVPVFSFFVVV